MKVYNINDDEIISSLEYQNFLRDNSASGILRIRAYAASEAIPIKGVKVEVSILIGENRVIFYEGETNESGLIDKISLPAPKLDSDNMAKPSSLIYDIFAIYPPSNLNTLYKVHIYEDICVVQNINIAYVNMEASNGS